MFYRYRDRSNMKIFYRNNSEIYCELRKSRNSENILRHNTARAARSRTYVSNIKMIFLMFYERATRNPFCGTITRRDSEGTLSHFERIH